MKLNYAQRQILGWGTAAVIGTVGRHKSHEIESLMLSAARTCGNPSALVDFARLLLQIVVAVLATAVFTWINADERPKKDRDY